MGEIMATRRKKIAIQIQNFKKVLRQIISVKKSLVGLIILIFFGLVAAFGPFFVTLDPVQVGSVPNPGVQLPAAEAYCVPSWYQGENITHNINVITDPQFSDPSTINSWNIKTTEGVSVEYDPNFGYARNRSIKITFQQDGNATLSINFQYPYKAPPQSFKGEYYYLISAINNASESEANITIDTNFQYLGSRVRTYPSSIPYSDYFTSEKMNQWTLIKNQVDSLSTPIFNYYMDTYGQEPVNRIFGKAGNYSFEFEVQFTGNTTELGNPTVYLDDPQLIVYGNAFGLLGTDQLARDIFTQLVVGARISFIIGIVSAVLSVGIGLIYGLASGYVGGIIDEAMMRINDMLLVIPTLPLLMVLVYAMGRSMTNIILVVGCLGWMGFARTVRSAVLSLKERLFIEAAKAVGAGRSYIMRRHLVPNVMALVYVTIAMGVPGAILYEAALSWLGLGPLDVMSWGRILYNFEQSGVIATGAFTKWYWVIPPGLCIGSLAIAFVLIGQALDEIFNPKLRERR
jgi:ABC-type dipeptide/oligopeptide/nickel transport system permease subunit